MLYGKIAAGKSTLADQLSAAPQTVVIREDPWLKTLFGDQMTTGADFVHYSGVLRAAMGPHVTALLRAGTSVVLDFQANTRDSRAWMRTIFEAASASHQLHVLDVPDAVCLARLRVRTAQGDHPFAATEAQFHRFSRHLQPPTPDEGFTLRHHATPP
jgi:predicted kinase